MKGLNTAKIRVLGERTVPTFKNCSRVLSSRKLQRIQKQIGAVSRALSKASGEERSELYDRLQDLRARKAKAQGELHRKKFEKLLDKLDSLDFSGRSKLVYKKINNKYKRQSFEIGGVIRGVDGSFSNCVEEFIENWKTFYLKPLI